MHNSETLNQQNKRFENPEPDFYVTLLISLPEKYPDDPPNFDVSGFPDDFPKEAIDELNNRLVEQSKSMPGYQVLITLITELQVRFPELYELQTKQQDQRETTM
ncbi:RWD domain-containing protein [Aphelenchoides besseyi]|nr:RWD domain-containing protein [Aphelenchoides besseyi]